MLSPPRRRGAGALLLPLALFLVACVPIAAIFARRAPTAQHSVMHSRAFGTCIAEVQDPLRWGADRSTANRICCHNRHYAEWSGYWSSTEFLAAARSSSEITLYDSVTGERLFVAPRGRTMDQFLAESRAHGWPSFRDAEVVRDNVVVLDDGEAVRHTLCPTCIGVQFEHAYSWPLQVSVNGTHLGHNLPDAMGNRYCINIVSIAGFPRS
jgi:peptide methionine sulfoxide reductase MsrB